MRIACCILSYEITKGMKSVGPIGLLKKNQKSKALILQQIDDLKKIFRNVDIYVVTGFGNEKLQEAIKNKRNVSTIVNQQYSNKNHSYAIKLFLQTIEKSIENYHGAFIIDSNIIIKKIAAKKKNASWLVISKKANQNIKNNIGVNYNENTGQARYLFYNIGNLHWCQSIYLKQSHLKQIIKIINRYHDNMFLFELINQIIDDYQLDIYINYLQKNKDFIQISGPKDKSKIK